MKLNFEKILNRVNNGIIVLDNKRNFIFVNKAALKLSPDKNIIGKNIWKEFPQLRNTQIEKCYRNAMRTQKPITFDYEGPITKKIYKFSAHPSKDGLIVFSINITDKVVVERNLKKALHEKEVLVKEAHHRIKNNLQIVSSLLNFQIKRIKDKDVRNIFTDTQNRIASIAIIHKNLYHSSSLSLINVKSLLSDFIDNLLKSLMPDKKKIKITKNIDEMIVYSELAVAISLILNELITNSIKYAFEGNQGKISVKLKDSKNYVNLDVTDNGIGLPVDFDISKSKGIGFIIINSLVDQHGGNFKYHFNKGSHFSIRFKKDSPTYKIK